MKERLSVKKLAKHFRVSVEQAQAAQDDIGFMYRELASPVTSTQAPAQCAPTEQIPVGYIVRNKETGAIASQHIALNRPDAEAWANTFKPEWELQPVYLAANGYTLTSTDGGPVAYLHVMHMELGQTSQRLTFNTTPAFGVPGEDYSEEYTVSCTPLYALTRP